MITTTMSMMNPVRFKFIEAIIFVVCLVLQLCCAEHEIMCIQSEREVLLQFKAAIVDRYGMLSSWTTADCCQWEGIRCSNLTGHILMLDLHGKYNEYAFSDITSSQIYISGEIHKSLMDLKQLMYLDLSWNSFPDRGIPEFLGSLSNLRYLDLSHSYFGRKIPSQFGSLSHLKYLNLSHNSLEGSIPCQLGNLSMLQHLDLSANSLEGNIPSQLGNLSKLQHLGLSANSLEGNIPSQLGNLSKLQHLGLSANSLEGNIPSQLGNLTNLQKLYLGGSYHGGSGALKIDDGNHAGAQWLSNLISLTHLSLSYMSNLNSSYSWLQMIAKLPKLRELSLRYCSLSDHFILSKRPSKFNFSTSLSVLDLSQNSFTSSMIFQWVSNITSNLVELRLRYNFLEDSTSNHFGLVMNSLEHLDLSNNRFKGEVLQSFMKICTLHSLNMQQNNLTEDLSSILHNLSSGCLQYSLQELDLSSNQITGSLPDLSVFSSLETLILDRNQLSGMIAKGIRLPSKLEFLSISSNSIEGGVPKLFGNACALSSLDLSFNNLSKELPVIIHHLSGCARKSLQELDLGGNQIKGMLPDLSMFSTLKTLDLSVNQLNGKIPEGSKLPSQLESLSILSNTLEGGIPKSFGNACTLRSLDVSQNGLSEEFPMIIHQLSGCARYSLEHLDLSMNQINGTLPDLSIFSSLKRLYLYGNKLNGEIPKDIQFPPQLQRLDMQSNSLKGVITNYHFANMSKLYSLDLSGNSLALAFTQNWVPPFQLSYIVLRSCMLGPAFPKWLQTQNILHILDISNCSISDLVPEWFWAKLEIQGLDFVDISFNNLRGTIHNFPLETVPISLNLASNKFEGPIPPFLRGSIFLDLSKNKFSNSYLFLCANGTTEELSQLDLANNKLCGQIPDCWSHFKSLTYLNLSDNNFSGKIPTSMGLLLDLQALLLRNNNLTDEIPSSLRSCTKLVMLDMAENRLSGPIPAWIGSKIQELQILSLERNHFYGSLPLQICYLRSIQLLDLSLNNLSGHIPKCIKNFTSMAQKTSSRDYGGHSYPINTNHFSGSWSYELNAFLMWKGSKRMFKNNGLSLLKSIDLSNNHFSEEIPTEIENLFQLVSLNLSRNNSIGKIPSNIGKLTSLEFLDLSRNRLVGSIPPSLTQIDRLTMLDLSHNHLTGEIPIGTQLQSFNALSYEDNLDLCGPPLEKLCIDGEPTHEPNVEVHEDEYSLFSREFYISMAFGFVISFWMVFGGILFKRSWQHAYFKFLNNLSDNIYVKVAVLANKISKVVEA